MRSGPLRHRVTFQNRVTTKDAFGQLTESWSDLFTVWASVEPISGRELLAAQQTLGEITHRIRTRYRDGITAATRVLFNGRIFDIESSINDKEKNAYLEIMAKEGTTIG